MISVTISEFILIVGIFFLLGFGIGVFIMAKAVEEEFKKRDKETA